MGLDDFKNKPAETARRKQRREREKEKDPFLAELFRGFENVDLGKAFDTMRRQVGGVISLDRRKLPDVSTMPPFRPEDERPYPD